MHCRQPHDQRAHTPEAQATRAERQERRQNPSPGTSARSCCAFWLNEFLDDRQPGEPYPLGRQYARRFLAHIQNLHQAMLAGHQSLFYVDDNPRPCCQAAYYQPHFVGWCS